MLSDMSIGLVAENQPGNFKLYTTLDAPHIYTKTEVDALLSIVADGSSRINNIEVTNISGGTSGVQLFGTDFTGVLASVSPYGISLYKGTTCHKGLITEGVDIALTCNGTAILTGDISSAGAILTDTMRAKTANAITINDNVIINGSLIYY